MQLNAPILQYIKGTQLIISLNYLFEKPLTPSEVSLYEKFNGHCFRIARNFFLATKKGSAVISGNAIRPMVFGKRTKNL